MSGYGGNQTRRRKTKALDDRTTRDILMPEVRLILAILARAGLDALNGDRRAWLFISSTEFENYCDWIGVNAGRLRQRLQEAKTNERFYVS